MFPGTGVPEHTGAVKQDIVASHPAAVIILSDKKTIVNAPSAAEEVITPGDTVP